LSADRVEHICRACDIPAVVHLHQEKEGIKYLTVRQCSAWLLMQGRKFMANNTGLDHCHLSFVSPVSTT